MQLSPFSILEQESAKLSKALWDTIMCKASASSLLFPNFRIKIFFFFSISVTLHEEKVNKIVHLHTAYLLGH